jgi:hypothetical protein
MADSLPALPDDPDQLIARALESVLEAVPEPLGADLGAAEAGPKAQPWAETAAPPGRNKRPLEEVVAEFAARVAAAPDARAAHPAETHPAVAYLEGLAAVMGKATPKTPGRRRWHGGKRRRGRGRRGGGGGGGERA